MSAIDDLIATLQGVTEDLDQARTAASRAGDAIGSAPATDTLDAVKSNADTLAEEISRAIDMADEIVVQLHALAGRPAGDEDISTEPPVPRAGIKSWWRDISPYASAIGAAICITWSFTYSYVPTSWRAAVRILVWLICVACAVHAFGIWRTSVRERREKAAEADQLDLDERTIEPKSIP